MIGLLARWPRALWRLLWVALHLLHGLALVALRVQGRPPDVREPYIRWWSQRQSWRWHLCMQLPAAWPNVTESYASQTA